MMNKGLEMIEAHHLFQLPPERIDIVDPSAIDRSTALVTYRDGSVLAHLGSPDMRTPIAYALGWPGRTAAPTQRLDLAAIGRLTFEAPDERALSGAAPGARGAGSAAAARPTVLNAANETAVHAFLDGRIGFLDIAATVERTLEAMPGGDLESLDDVYNFDQAAREIAAELVAPRGIARRQSHGRINDEFTDAFLHGGLSIYVGRCFWSS